MSRSSLRTALHSAALALLLPLAAVAQTQPAAPTTLSLEDAISIARMNNPTFLAAQNDMHVARWRVRSAHADFLPSANVSTGFAYQQAGEQRVGAVGFGERPAYYSSDYNLGVSLELNGSKLLQPAVARATARATEQQIEGAEAQLVSNVVQQYLGVLQAQATAAQAEREVARTGEHVRLAQARLEVGAGTQLDVRRSQVQQGQAEIRLLQARNSQATATLALGQLMGMPLEPGVALTTEVEMFQPVWQTEELVQLALRNNPRLLAARATAEASSTNLRQAQSAYLPRLTLSSGLRGSVFRAGDLDPLINQQLNESSFQSCLQTNQIREAAGLPPQPCLNPTNVEHREVVRQRLAQDNPEWPFGYTRQPITTSLTISLPLFTGLTRQVNVAQAQVNAQDARYQVRAQELQLYTDVGTALRNVQTAFQTSQLQARVRETAAEELRLAEERFRFGAASSIEVTDAQTRLAETEQAEIDATYSFHQSLAILEALIGQPLR